ncbi:helix-turn-helix domain-containing protein [Metabacillus idriensis]|uniref:helix-turn-helix domain-containing protein n=1 Tax=Metabacillus idriensis TaxID=324768 RepID=UPI001748C372|nr:helix-turn-helix transcriptional regulator [Metabacillus idriensis]MCM3599026.1 helix-turn-helix domain-containing protein [Metabacillus idriensis]
MKPLIGEIIEAKGLKKKYVAQSMGITPNQLSNWIKGRSFPPMDKAFKLAEFLEVRVDDLYYSKEEK